MNQTTLPSSPPWGRTTRLIVGLVGLAILALLMWRFQALVGQIIVSAMLAYVLDPFVGLLARRTRLSRGLAALIVYLLLVLVGLGVLALVGVALVNQVTALVARIPALIDQAAGLISRFGKSSIDIGPLHFASGSIDWNAVGAQLLEMVRPALGQSGQVAGQVAFGALDVVGWLAVTFIISIYFELDLLRLGLQIAAVAQHSGYAADYSRITLDISRIWSRYLRGQVILGIIIALITWIMLAILGVDNSLALGLISGILTIVPYVGPTLSAVLIVLVALFQPANYLGLAPGQYALLVGIVTLVVQQVSGNLLLPLIVGGALNMSPLTVLISLIAGAAVAGILGVILAAPVAATLMVVLDYTWRKLLDLPPFPEAEPPPTRMSRIIRRTAAIAQQIQRARFGGKPLNKTIPDETGEKP